MQQTIDPYVMLQLPKNYTLDMLKANYKRLALQLHPDRNNPTTTAMFQILTNCYKQLLKDYQLRMQQPEHHDLKTQAKQHYQQQINQPLQNTSLHSRNAQKFDVDRFNQVFQDNRIEDAYQQGYEKWLRSTDEASLVAKNKQIVVYKQPEPLEAAKGMSQYYHLGVDRIHDHSAMDLGYMDLRVAHSVDKLVDERNFRQRKEYKSINELEQERSSISFVPNEKDMHDFHKKELREKKKEQERLRRLQQFDQLTEEQYLRLNKLMIGGGN